MSGQSVALREVVFRYEEMVMRFDLEVLAGEIVAVTGPSGSGKSTLLNLIAGFEMPETGRVFIAGQDVTGLPPGKRPVSMVFQENNLFGHLDLTANVGLGRSPSLRLSEDDRIDVARALERVGLGGKDRRKPGELSGGERQRAALARVLVRDRPVLLLDEPFASLGPALRSDMLDLLRDLHDEAGMTVLMVTHNPGDARVFSDRTVFLENGAVIAFAPTGEIFGKNAHPAVRRYLGSGD